MTTELVPATRASSEITTAAQWDAEQLAILKADLGIKTDAHLAYFSQVCGHKNLDPFLDEIVPIYYGDDMVIQETVEGLRTIAERSGLYGGYRGPWYCGPDRQWHEGIWLDPGPPAGAKYLVIRKDWAEPAPGYARWASCVQLDRYGKPRGLWKTRPDEMLAKTAEARALKRAFSKEFARAGVNVRTLTDNQIIAAEGRRIGLSDEDRHALVAEITDGRTESSTELTDEERLAARAEIARRARKVTAAGPGGTETYWVDPETGERFLPTSEEEGAPPEAPAPDDEEVTDNNVVATDPEPGPERSPAAPDPAGNTTDGYVETDGRVRVPNKKEDERLRLIAELVPRARALEDEARALFQAWLDGAKIGRAKHVKDYTLAELRKVEKALLEFEQPVGEEPF